MHSDRAMVTEQQRRAQAALLNSEAESGERVAGVDGSADERTHVIDGLRRRWSQLQMQRLTEVG